MSIFNEFKVVETRKTWQPLVGGKRTNEDREMEELYGNSAELLY